jgi:hypothetical protein
MPVAAMIAMVVISAAATAKEMSDASSARKAQQQAQNTQEADQQAQRVQEMRDQYRQQRIKAAQIAQSSANTGVQYSSGNYGSQSALGSTIANNVSSIERSGVTTNAIGADEQRSADFMANAQTVGAIGSLAGQALGMFGTYSRLSTPPNYGTNANLPKSMNSSSSDSSGASSGWWSTPNWYKTSGGYPS